MTRTVDLNKIYNQDCMDGMKEIPDKFFDLAEERIKEFNEQRSVSRNDV